MAASSPVEAPTRTLGSVIFGSPASSGKRYPGGCLAAHPARLANFVRRTDIRGSLLRGEPGIARIPAPCTSAAIACAPGPGWLLLFSRALGEAPLVGGQLSLEM